MGKNRIGMPELYKDDYKAALRGFKRGIKKSLTELEAIMKGEKELSKIEGEASRG